MRLLIIEDEARIAEILRSALSRSGFAVDAVGLCEDARASLAVNPYDAVILDLGLPEQVYTLPPQAIHLYPYPEPYYGWDPWFYGAPVFVGGPVFFAHGFHRFHHDGFHHRGFPHGGFPHGGFAHGGFHGGRR